MRRLYRTPLAVRRWIAFGASVIVAVSWGFPTSPASARDPAVPARSSAAPAPTGELTITADRIEYNSLTKVATADGHVRAEGSDSVLTADHVEANTETQDVAASGHIMLESSGTMATGSLLKYNFGTHVGHMEQIEGSYPPWHVAGQVIDVAPEQDVAQNASLTPCDPSRPIFKIAARKIVIVPNDHITAYDASIYVAGIRIITLPVYTSTLGRRGGPTFGFSTPDGLYLEYLHSFPVGEAHDDFRVRLATGTGLTAENLLFDRSGDHTWSLDLGRHPTTDINGNLVNIDRYSLDLEYDRAQIPGTPIAVQFEAHGGYYHELATGVSTSRAEGLLNVSTDTFRLSPSLYFSAGGQARFDAYGTGQQRTIFEESAALSDTLDLRSSASLSYSGVAVAGATPFSFDAIGPSSTTSLSYSYSFGGFVQSAGVSLTYDFLARQTSTGLNVAMSITPDIAFNVSAYYNLTTQQLTEIDYAVNVRCDCVTVGLVYRSFPQNPGGNALMVTFGLNVFPGKNISYSGPGLSY